MYIIIGTLDAPDITSERIGSNHLAISWNSLNGSVCGMVQYHLQLSLIDDETLETVLTTNLSYTFTELSINTAYFITVYGSNNAGNGETNRIPLTTRSKLKIYPVV